MPMKPGKATPISSGPVSGVKPGDVRRQALRRLFEEHSGVVRWEDFMAAALYDPEAGYYMTGIRTVGARGDFSTCATLSTSLAAAVARWACRGRWLGPGFVEIGGGNGAFAEAFGRSLPWWRAFRLRHVLVEISPVLKKCQQACALRQAKWATDPRAALALAGADACIFANELIDAFPCVALRCCEAGWEELCVMECAGGARLDWRTCTARGHEAVAASGLKNAPVGWSGEVHLSFREWLASWSDAAPTGTRMLLVDYGQAPGQRNTSSSPTLRGYFAHQPVRGAELLHRFGRQDLTADVRFADVARWANECGWRLAWTGTQAEFVALHSPRESTALADKGGSARRIVDAADAGGRFVAVEFVRTT